MINKTIKLKCLKSIKKIKIRIKNILKNYENILYILSKNFNKIIK